MLRSERKATVEHFQDIGAEALNTTDVSSPHLFAIK